VSPLVAPLSEDPQRVRDRVINPPEAIGELIVMRHAPQQAVLKDANLVRLTFL
jgi:hypothetical protein